MPVRTLIAIAVLAWRVTAYLNHPSALHYGLLVAQIGIALMYLSVTLCGYGRGVVRHSRM
jgi:hypothetical protein